MRKGKSERDNSTSREQPKRSCRKKQTLLSRSGPDNLSVTVRLASAEDKEVNFVSISSATKKKNGILDLLPQLREMNQIMTPLNPLNPLNLMMLCHSISMIIWDCMNLKM